MSHLQQDVKVNSSLASNIPKHTGLEASLEFRPPAAMAKYTRTATGSLLGS